jgi:hypothetical protein
MKNFSRALIALGAFLGAAQAQGAAPTAPSVGAPAAARFLIYVERDEATLYRETSRGSSKIEGPAESGSLVVDFGSSGRFASTAPMTYTSKFEKLEDGAALRTERSVQQGFSAKIEPKGLDANGDALALIELSDARYVLRSNPDGSQTPIMEPGLSRKATVALAPYAKPRMVAEGFGARVFMAVDFGPEPRAMFKARSSPGPNDAPARPMLFATMKGCLERLGLDAQDPAFAAAAARGQASATCSAETQHPAPQQPATR